MFASWVHVLQRPALSDETTELASTVSDYRYSLVRYIGGGRVGNLCWVMLNPSTADETTDDPTIRRVKRFTSDYGYESLTVVNLFAMRATEPDDLYNAAGSGLDPVGIDNAEAIRRAFNACHGVVFAWGAWPGVKKLTHPNVEGLARLCDKPVRCLGHTKSGAPRHPLYVKATQPLVGFR